MHDAGGLVSRERMHKHYDRGYPESRFGQKHQGHFDFHCRRIGAMPLELVVGCLAMRDFKR
jgi:hypothetical protein